MSYKTALLLLALTSAATTAPAQTMKPGQWEFTNKLKNNNAQMDLAMSQAMQQLANMPPEQRQQIEAMMAQNGVSMPKLSSDGGMSVKVCITQAMADKHELPVGQQGNCTSRNTPVAGGMNISFSCSNPSSNGQGQLRYSGDSAFTMRMNVSSNQGGQPIQTTVESAGRWLGACTGKP